MQLLVIKGSELVVMLHHRINVQENQAKGGFIETYMQGAGRHTSSKVVVGQQHGGRRVLQAEGQPVGRVVWIKGHVRSPAAPNKAGQHTKQKKVP